MASTEKQFLSTKEAAQLLDVHPDTLCRWRKKKGLGPKWRKRGVGARSRVVYARIDIEIWDQSTIRE